MVYIGLRCLAGSMLGRHVEAYMYKQTGDPSKVLVRESVKLQDRLNEGEVVVKMLATPINPSDINIIQGIYPFQPSLPYVAGNEGVGEVIEVGGGVKQVGVGDRVIPRSFGFGTWRTYSVCRETDLMLIGKDLPVISAATLAVNACTAYRLLNDFINLSTDDTIIQNGSNSAVGQAVIQLAVCRGIKTINIIRKRSDLDAVASELQALGGTRVLTDEQLRSCDLNEPIRLGLNCVGGKATADLCRVVSPGGTVVTYGGMSKQPLMIPAAALIFSDITLRGFWLSRWNETHEAEAGQMWHDLSDLVTKGQLKPPKHHVVQFSQLSEAVAASMQPMTNTKQIVVF